MSQDKGTLRRYLYIVIVNLIALGFIYAVVNKIIDGLTYDTIGSPLLYPGGTISVKISIVFVLQFIFALVSFAYLKPFRNKKHFFSNSIHNPGKSEFIYEYLLDYFSLPIVSIYTLVLVNFNVFYNLPFELFRNYLVMLLTFLAIGICLYLFFRVIQITIAQPSVRHNLRRTLIAISPIVFGVGTFIRNQKVSDSLALIVFMFFVLLSLAFYFADKSSRITRILNPAHLFVNLPILSFLLYSRTYGDVKNLHAYESFHFSNAQMLSRGFLPWRDFSTEHGLWESGFREYLGGFIVDNTIWGQLNGLYSFITPLEVSVAAVCIYLISRNFLFVVAVLVINRYLETSYGISIFFPRMLIIFVLALVLIRYSKNPSFKNSFYLMITASLGLVWSHEFIYLVIGTLISIILLSFHYKDVFTQVFYRCILFIIGTTILLLLVLTPFGLFTNYIDQFLSNSSGYFFAWGMSFQWGLGVIYFLLFFTVPFLLFLYLSKTLSLLISRSANTPSYLALVPIALCSLLFYIKFLNWADWHLTQPTNVLLVLLVFWAAISFTHFQMRILGIACSTLLVLTLVSSVNTGVGDLQYLPSKKHSPTIGHMDAVSSAYETRVSNVLNSFQYYIGDQKYIPILDFANEPLTWFGVFEFRPAGGIDKVLNIASASSQNSVISKLKNDMPDAVIWGGEYGYWDSLFNGTWMRQYELTYFIMKHYKPVASEGRYVLLMSGVKHELNSSAKEVMISDKCDWALGSPKFREPKKVQIRKAMPPLNYIQKNENLNTSNFSTDSRFKDIGFAVRSDRDVQIRMTGVGNTRGQIIFTVNRSDKPQVVWLGGCSTWFYQHANSQWNVEVGEAEVEIFPVSLTDE